jgi:RNA polymerase sigma-70 factor, ECF subfamily
VEGAVVEPDPQLVAAARAGDLDAFSQLVRRYQGHVWRLSFHLVRNDAVADDVTQDAFVRAYRFLSRYRGESRFSTWLFSITRNCAIDELRRAGRRKRLSDRLENPAAFTTRDAGLRHEIPFPEAQDLAANHSRITGPEHQGDGESN